jgi:hypothetical protein
MKFSPMGFNITMKFTTYFYKVEKCVRKVMQISFLQIYDHLSLR